MANEKTREGVRMGEAPSQVASHAVRQEHPTREPRATDVAAVQRGLGNRTLAGMLTPWRDATAGAFQQVPHRESMEKAFAADFSSVKAYLGRAGPLAEIGASAATDGMSIAFRSLAPSRDTVAHELAHVLQYRNAAARGAVATVRGLSRGSDGAEREASWAADQALGGGTPSPMTFPAATVMRLESTDEELDADPTDALTSSTPAKPQGRTWHQFESEHPKLAGQMKEAVAFHRPLPQALIDAAKAVGVLNGTIANIVVGYFVDVVTRETQMMREDSYDVSSLAAWNAMMLQSTGLYPSMLIKQAMASNKDPQWLVELEAIEARRQQVYQLALEISRDPLIQDADEHNDERAADNAAQRRLRETIDHIKSHTDRHWSADLPPIQASQFGLLLAQYLVRERRLSGEQIREVFEELRAQDPQLLEAALFFGRTIDHLHALGVFGFDVVDEENKDIYRAQGEGMLAGFGRTLVEDQARATPSSTNSPRAELGAWDYAAFILNFELGIPVGAGLWIKDQVMDLIQLLPTLWELVTDVIPKLLTDEQYTFEMGKGLARSMADYAEDVSNDSPAELGRRIGEYFGYAVMEIVSWFIGVGAVMTAAKAGKLGRYGTKVVELAEGMAKSAIAAKGLKVVRSVTEAIEALTDRIDAIRRRLRLLRSAEERYEDFLADLDDMASLTKKAEAVAARGDEASAVATTAQVTDRVQEAEQRLASIERSESSALVPAHAIEGPSSRPATTGSNHPTLPLAVRDQPGVGTPTDSRDAQLPVKWQRGDIVPYERQRAEFPTAGTRGEFDVIPQEDGSELLLRPERPSAKPIDDHFPHPRPTSNGAIPDARNSGFPQPGNARPSRPTNADATEQLSRLEEPGFADADAGRELDELFQRSNEPQQPLVVYGAPGTTDAPMPSAVTVASPPEATSTVHALSTTPQLTGPVSTPLPTAESPTAGSPTRRRRLALEQTPEQAARNAEAVRTVKGKPADGTALELRSTQPGAPRRWHRMNRVASKRRAYLGQPDLPALRDRVIARDMGTTIKVDAHGNLEYLDPDTGDWMPEGTEQLGHVVSAGTWWNTFGKYLGPRSRQATMFMEDTPNYRFEHYEPNATRGATIDPRYDDPATTLPSRAMLEDLARRWGYPRTAPLGQPDPGPLTDPDIQDLLNRG